ncbi:MFS general substrate transporter [Cucurbitaria berberidis CBS 394.84]|uniref:MFS general substrate transporter n=1 Tax=Cucurbitaria berberidis CBS 394.84 TaxID=1168544 RepID=A0A9P4GGV3_9PLEO|nr:MFS general substrate transporter [Cucurbitaria berberidis CBS 394.84]KAF1845206.1 MFS general substrate transporter [Cucurbitaria berberidis CBS 394.84]
MMEHNEETSAVSLCEPQRSNFSVQEPDIGNNNDHAGRQRVLDRKRALALIGSALSQLPIWGFAMSYGVLQEYYFDHWTLQGSRRITGIIGTTSNGVMYLSMPFLFALFSKRLAHYRQPAAICGALLACASFILSSFSKHVWHLVATQGVLAALGCALVYSPMTLSLGERFNTPNRICNRAIAYGICLSTKNIVGSVCPFIFRGLLDRYGFRTTLIIWAGITAATAILSIFMVQTPCSSMVTSTPRGRKIAWQFIRHQTFWVYSMATLLQSAGYGIPQTYLSEYARNVSALSPTFSTLLLTLINIPGICSSTFFGFLSDNKHFQLSAPTVTAISAISSALAAFLFWGLAARGGIALLVLFAITFGFFASGYSATWAGIMNDMEQDAAERNEALDSGVLYGLLNGARGIGYVGGGLVSVPLIKAGSTDSVGNFGYGSTYGPLIIFTGLALALGGCGLAVHPNWTKILHLR